MPRRKSNSVHSWIKNHTFEILVGLSIIFLLILLIFGKQVNNFLKDKQDFYLPKLTKVKSPILKKNENRCRYIFETILNKPFPNLRPKFMKRSNGRCLELDGYNSDLKLAFEYNGIQHSKFSPRFHKSEKDFESQKQRDIDKKELCKKNNITLIIIPHTIAFQNLESYIRQQLKEHKYI
jgi:hypothetical protein